jgi:hypothetical protein
MDRCGRWSASLFSRPLARVKENRTHAAKELGISIRTLRNKLREYRDMGYQVEAEEVLIAPAGRWADYSPRWTFLPGAARNAAHRGDVIQIRSAASAVYVLHTLWR